MLSQIQGFQPPQPNAKDIKRQIQLPQVPQGYVDC